MRRSRDVWRFLPRHRPARRSLVRSRLVTQHSLIAKHPNDDGTFGKITCHL